MRFHLVLVGECVVELGGGERALLKSGDMVLFPRGSAHAIVNVGHSQAQANPPLVDKLQGFVPQIVTEGPPEVSLLSGHFVHDPRTSGLLLDDLPDVFHVSLSAHRQKERIATIVELLKDETNRYLPGLQR